MPNVVPSQIVEYIDSRFQIVRQQIENPDNIFKCDSGRQAAISTILELIDQLPPNLLTITGEDFTRFTEAVNELKRAIILWSSDHASNRRHEIYKMTDGSKQNPITFIRIALSQCPDQGIDKEINGLEFIKDQEFKNNLLQDISYTNQALSNAEWKAATILAGSVIEALLLDAVNMFTNLNSKRRFDDIRNELSKESELGNPLKKKPPANINRWDLNQLIRFTFIAGIISEQTAKGCLIAKDFRNLIHPGVAIRIMMVCDRGTALKAVGAIEHVIKNLSKYEVSDDELIRSTVI